jgi:hypothetical protein
VLTIHNKHIILGSTGGGGEGAEGVYPAVSNVRSGVSYQTDKIGTLAVPLPSQVLSGVQTDNTVGTYVCPTPDYPAETDVLIGVEYGDGLEGEYVPHNQDYPAETNVLAGVVYNNGALTGLSVLPDPTNVLSGVNVGQTVGTYTCPVPDYPDEADVLLGVEYDNGNLVGSLEPGGGVVLPNDYPYGWLPPPTVDNTAKTINGKNQVIALICDVLDVSVNTFSFVAAGAYTINVYAAVGGALISSQNVASGAQGDWTIAYADCTHQVGDIRQAYIEIIPQAGQNITSLSFNTATHHLIAAVFIAIPYATTLFSAFSNRTVTAYAEIVHAPLLVTMTNTFTSSGIKRLILPALPEVTSMASIVNGASALRKLTVGATPKATTLNNAFYASKAIESIELAGLEFVTGTSSAFGSGAGQSCLSLRKLILSGLRVGFILNYTSMQAAELNALFTSLGTANGAQTIDVRNNPGSAACNPGIATAKGFTVLTA